MATRIKISTVTAGDYKRVHIFPVRNYHKGRRTRKFMPSSSAQQKYNDKMAALHVVDLLHTNFTEDDLAIRLSYDGVDVDMEAGTRCFSNFLRRLKRRYAKHGTELKALWRTEEGKNGGRVHHHLVINACSGVTDDDRAMKKIWNNGGFGKQSFVYMAHLEFNTSGGFVDGGLTGLAKYFVFGDGEAKHRQTACRYGHTRNLSEPIVEEKIGEISPAEASYINETTDASILEELYKDYTVRAVAPEIYDDDSENARYCTGLFTVVYMQRREMRFNVASKRK